MGIFSRTRDIVAANVADLLDRAEDPAKMIRMIIMEMEETLVEVRASAARTIADQKEMRRTIAKIEIAQTNWAEKAELALSKGREDLAKAALVEKAKLGSLSQQMQAEIVALDDALMHHEADIQKLEAKLREARGRQNAVLSRLETATNRAKMRNMYAGPRVDEAFAKFELLERRVDLAEGRAEVFELGKTRTLEDEIADLRTGDAVDAEFEELKNRIAQQKAAE
jgi:phage shock protein A